MPYASLVAGPDALPPDAPRALLAISKLVGRRGLRPPAAGHAGARHVGVLQEGTLQQYAGCLHREHASKTDLRIIDFVDAGHPTLLRMWDKRQRGYRAMGYRIKAEAARMKVFFDVPMHIQADLNWSERSGPDHPRQYGVKY